MSDQGIYYKGGHRRWLGIPVGYCSEHPPTRGFISGDVPSSDTWETNRAVWAPH